MKVKDEDKYWDKSSIAHWDTGNIKQRLCNLIGEEYNPEKKYSIKKGLLAKMDLGYIGVRAKKLICRVYNGSICPECKYSGFFGMHDHHISPSSKRETLSNICRGNAKASLWDILYECDQTKALCTNCHIVKRSRVPNEVKKMMLEHLGMNRCFNCRSKPDNLVVLSGHHREATEKKFSLSEVYMKSNGDLWVRGNKKRKARKISLKVFYEEVDKCDLLCARCHEVIHSNQAKFNRFYCNIVYRAVNFIETAEKQLLTGKCRKNRFKDKTHKRYTSKKKYKEFHPEAEDFFDKIVIVDPVKARDNPFSHVDNSSFAVKSRKRKNAIVKKILINNIRCNDRKITSPCL